MGMSLYEIDSRLVAAFDAAVDTETGEVLSEDALDEFHAMQMAWDDKVENIALWIKNLTAEAKAIKEEQDALAARRKAIEAKGDRLLRYLSGYLNGAKFETAKVKVSWRKSESVQIDDISAIPEEYLKYAAPTANKTDIKAAIKAGKEIPGAQIVVNQNMSIK